MVEVGTVILNITMVIVTMWIVKNFLEIFLEEKKKTIQSIGAWLLFFIFQVYVEFRNGSASVLVTVFNVIFVLYIAISSYEPKGKVKVFIVFLLYSIWSIIEMLVFFFINNVSVNFRQQDLIGNVISKIFMIIIIYLLSAFGKKAVYECVPAKYYIILLIIPVGSIYISMNEFFSKYYAYNTISTMLTCSILLIFNIIIFEMYAKISESFVLEKERIVYEQQIELISQNTECQRRVMENFYEEKHNLNNELIALKSSVENKDEISLIENINRIINASNVGEGIADSGNSIVDAIINFKYEIAKEMGIVFKLNIFIPDTFPINQCDMGIVLGNALDNAIEATKQCVNANKVIHISLGIKKEALVLVIKNPYETLIRIDKNGNLISNKKDRNRHGYGINSIKKVAEDYSGEVLTDMKENIFILTVVMNFRKF